jgi:RNA polymerase sigma factor (TIGR02999 family)
MSEFELQVKKDEGDLTVLLRSYARGDQRALSLLIDRVYAELRLIAARRLRGESHNPLMSPTALVNEAYLRIVGRDVPAEWINRSHFFAAASESMQRILVDQARQRLALKRGGVGIKQTIEEVAITVEMPDEKLLDLDMALKEFERVDPDKAELVKLRYFLGLSEVDAAEAMGISRATASRHWTYARAWLFRRLRELAPE